MEKETEQTYRVLKDWGDHKAGETFTASQLAEADAIAGLVDDGTIEAVTPDVPATQDAAEQPQAGTDEKANPEAPAEAQDSQQASSTDEASGETSPAAPDPAAEQSARVSPVTQGILEDMSTLMIPEDGSSYDLGPLELATLTRFKDADLTFLSEVPLAFQGVLAAVSGLAKVFQTTAYVDRHTQAEYAECARAILAILAKAQVNTADADTAATSLEGAKPELEALFAEKQLSAMEANYLFNSILTTFETARTGVEKSLEESMERAQAKMLGVADVTELSVGKLDTFLTS